MLIQKACGFCDVINKKKSHGGCCMHGSRFRRLQCHVHRRTQISKFESQISKEIPQKNAFKMV